MRNSEKADTLKQRILNLLENITYQSFVYTSRGLFEKDKLIFITQMVIQVSKLFNMTTFYIVYI
jgi:dynein heavy chain